MLLGMKVYHKTFGEGIIKNMAEGFICIKFKDGDHKFHFPEAFEKFLTLSDEMMQKEIVQWSLDRKSNRNKEKWIEFEKKVKHESKKRPSAKKNASKKLIRNNVAFKCNYCDGGKNDDQIGYDGVCSEQILRMNVKSRPWCSQPSCDCKRYLNKKITRAQLDEIHSNGGYVCNEGQILRDWTIMEGVYHNGPKKGEAMTIRGVTHNALCLLTTRMPEQKEADRFIFALFLVNGVYEGDEIESGTLTASSKYRLKFSKSEAKELKFWKYHKNETHSERPHWGTGLHRFIDDIESAQVLRDVVKVKEKTREEALAYELYEYYCNEIAFINPEDIGGLDGALMQ